MSDIAEFRAAMRDVSPIKHKADRVPTHDGKPKPEARRIFSRPHNSTRTNGRVWR